MHLNQNSKNFDLVPSLTPDGSSDYDLRNRKVKHCAGHLPCFHSLYFDNTSTRCNHSFSGQMQTVVSPGLQLWANDRFKILNYTFKCCYIPTGEYIKMQLLRVKDTHNSSVLEAIATHTRCLKWLFPIIYTAF